MGPSGMHYRKRGGKKFPASPQYSTVHNLRYNILYCAKMWFSRRRYLQRLQSSSCDSKNAFLSHVMKLPKKTNSFRKFEVEFSVAELDIADNTSTSECSTSAETYSLKELSANTFHSFDENMHSNVEESTQQKELTYSKLCDQVDFSTNVDDRVPHFTSASPKQKKDTRGKLHQLQRSDRSTVIPNLDSCNHMKKTNEDNEETTPFPCDGFLPARFQRSSHAIPQTETVQGRIPPDIRSLINRGISSTRYDQDDRVIVKSILL